MNLIKLCFSVIVLLGLTTASDMHDIHVAARSWKEASDIAASFLHSQQVSSGEHELQVPQNVTGNTGANESDDASSGSLLFANATQNGGQESDDASSGSLLFATATQNGGQESDDASSGIQAPVSLLHTRYKVNRGPHIVAAEPAFYAFGQNDGGYVIVSADDRTVPVLAYSPDDEFDADVVNPNFRFWLDMLQQDISAIPDDAVFNMAVGNDVPVSAISPLLVNSAGVYINWNQGAPYNNLCPVDNLDNTVSMTGCVATAAAMVMYKWRYPEKGTGSRTYNWNDIVLWNSEKTSPIRYEVIELSADFGNTVYDWDNMLPAYAKVQATERQKNAVATLMYHLGVACDMQYGGIGNSGSTSYLEDMASGLEEYFGYKYDKFVVTCSAMEYGSPFVHDTETGATKSKMAAYINSDLEAGRPVIMGGVSDSNMGHAFVCDGRDSRGYFHFNWGWDGQCNNYCLLTDMIPDGLGVNLSSMVEAVIGLEPKDLPGDSKVDDITSDRMQNMKILRDGRIMILHDGKVYDTQGVEWE
ncbi:MAG: C10 family peptidase [Bacteroidaceae bacterium]|nr:C10 family peptidase [Bacteroidaceae bacterium]